MKSFFGLGKQRWFVGFVRKGKPQKEVKRRRRKSIRCNKKSIRERKREVEKPSFKFFWFNTLRHHASQIWTTNHIALFFLSSDATFTPNFVYIILSEELTGSPL
jgi:hypothetical protein